MYFTLGVIMLFGLFLWVSVKDKTDMDAGELVISILLSAVYTLSTSAILGMMAFVIMVIGMASGLVEYSF